MNERLAPNQAPRQDLIESVSLLSLFDVVRRRKFLLFIPIIVSTGISLYGALNVTYRYQARVLMALDSPADQALRFNPLATVGGRFNRIRETINQRSLLEPVMQEFNLFGSSGEPIGERQLDNMRQSVGIEIEGARTFHFTFADRDPEKAAQVVTRISERFIAEMESRQEDSAAAAVEVLAAEADRAEQEMLDRYRAMENYRDQVTGPLGQDLDVYVASVGNTNQRLEANRADIANLEATRRTNQSEIDQLERLVGYQATDTSPVISSQRRALERELELALERWTEQHPEVVRIRNELAMLDDGSVADPAATAGGGGPSGVDMRLISLRATRESLDARLEFLYEQRQELLSTQTEYEAIADVIPEREETLSRLVRQHEVARAAYSDLLQRLGNARLNAKLQPAGGPLKYSIVEPARTPINPINPQRRRRVYFGFALGVAIGLTLMLLAQQLDTSFNDIQDLRAITGLPVLASIPSMPRGFLRRSKSKTPLPTLNDRVSIASEQFRILAVRLHDLIDREYSHVVLFTGSAGGEGKTTTVLNTAIALSQVQDDKVLLIDADLRKPRARLYLNGQVEKLGNEEGLRTLLEHPNEISQDVFGRVGKLYVLAGTSGTSDSVSEIVSTDFRKLIARLRKTFQYILIDSPPVLPMADSHLLAEIADRVVFVVRARRTRRETLARALEAFDPRNVLGLILNDVSYEHARYGQAYRHYRKNYLSKPRKTRVRFRNTT